MLPLPDQEMLLAPLQPLLANGTVSAIRLSTRPDAIDADGAAFLLDHGVKTVELGVQSLDDAVLGAAGRGHTAKDVRDAVGILHETGLCVGIQLMPGLPGSSREQDLASLDGALGLSPAFIRIYPALVLEGTGLAGIYEAGEYEPLVLEEAVSLSACMLHRCMKAKVPVVRVGLQATDSLCQPGKIVAGPFHPAFRQLVESELCLCLMRKITGGLDCGTKVIVRCAPSRVSDVAGQRRANLDKIAATGIIVERIVTDNSLSPLEMIIITPLGERRGNLLNDLEFNNKGNLYD